MFENELILAECAARNGNLNDGLPHLNKVRAWMNTGGHLNSNFQGEAYSYLAYDVADFENGGIENTDGIDSKKAFLREVIEERYVSGFGMHIPYNDSRRLISQGAAKINGKKISDFIYLITEKDILENNTIQVSIGKKKHALVKIIQ